jgi:hypothetical protein
MRVTPGDLRPAEGCEREKHGAGHLALIGPLLWRLEAGPEVAFAFLLDDGAKLDVTAGAVFAGLEHFHRR